MRNFKFGFYTDTHVSHINPQHRTDDYSSAILNKIDEIYSVCKSEKVDFMLFGGDMFNAHKAGDFWQLNRFMGILNKCALQTFSIVGQHDLAGYNDSSYERSTLSMLEHNPFWTVVRGESNPLPFVSVNSCHVYDDHEEFLKKQLDKSKINIGMAHKLFYDKDAIFDVINVTKLEKNDFNLVLSGDLHCGYNPTLNEGTCYANPGSICRRTIDEQSKIPHYYIIECKVDDGDPYFEFEHRKVDCARLGSEIFTESILRTFKKDDKGHLAEAAVNKLKEVAEREQAVSDIFELIALKKFEMAIDTKVFDYIMSKRV